MIVKTTPINIFDTEAKHIAFAINSEGYNDAGFAGVVAKKYWNELLYCGENEIGTVLSKTIGDKTYHALVCHSLNNGWGDNQREIIKELFDKIPSNGEMISSIAIGTGFVGMMTGAKFGQIVCGMQDSKQNIELCCELSLNAINSFYEDENAAVKKKSDDLKN